MPRTRLRGSWANGSICASERERHENEALLKARVVQMWQTRLLRFASLTVRDEIENALSYYHTTFLREIPRLYAELEELLRGRAHRAVLSHGLLDRRRSRRQSQRQCRDAEGGVPAAKRDRAAALSGGGA